MAIDNTITVSGSLGADPNLRYTQTGRPVASVGLAVSRRWQSNGEWQEETSWFQIQVWSDLAENFAASCSKGDRVVVTGRMSQRSYEDKEGNSRYAYEIVADDIGPSLKWAQATVERVARDEPGRGGSTGNSSASHSNVDGLPDEEPPF